MAVDLVLADPDVVLLVKEVANRVSDCGLLEQPGRDLVEKRLEGVVVVLVDEHDVDVALRQLLGGADTGKAAAQDEDAGTPAVRFGRALKATRAYRPAASPESSRAGETGRALRGPHYVPFIPFGRSASRPPRRLRQRRGRANCRSRGAVIPTSQRPGHARKQSKRLLRVVRSPTAAIERRGRLGDLIHEYSLVKRVRAPFAVADPHRSVRAWLQVSRSLRRSSSR